LKGPMLEALWKKVLDHWDDDAAHGKFLEYCQTSEQLAEAASHYAGMRGDRERGAAAQKKLEAVSLLATSSLLASKSDRLPRLPKWFTVAVLLLFSALGGYVLLRALR
jgi:hypothetical protein